MMLVRTGPHGIGAVWEEVDGDKGTICQPQAIILQHFINIITTPLFSLIILQCAIIVESNYRRINILLHCYIKYRPWQKVCETHVLVEYHIPKPWTIV